MKKVFVRRKVKQLPAQGRVETGTVDRGGGREVSKGGDGWPATASGLGFPTRRPHGHCCVPPGRARINTRFHPVMALGPPWPDLSPQLPLQSSAAVITDSLLFAAPNVSFLWDFSLA